MFIFFIYKFVFYEMDQVMMVNLGRNEEDNIVFSTRVSRYLRSLRKRCRFKRYSSSARFIWRYIDIRGTNDFLKIIRLRIPTVVYVCFS